MDLENWEIEKENIRPCKYGRKMKLLREALDIRNKKSSPDIIEITSNKFREEIKNYSGDDPLSLWLDYKDYIENIYVSTVRSPLIQIMEEALNTCFKIERYKQDERYVHLWLSYANYQEDPTEIFEYMKANSIGTEIYLTYISYAIVAEQRRDFSTAEQIYSEAIEKLVGDRNIIENYHVEFLCRMKKELLKYINERRQEGRKITDDLKMIYENKITKTQLKILTLHFKSPKNGKLRYTTNTINGSNINIINNNGTGANNNLFQSRNQTNNPTNHSFFNNSLHFPQSNTNNISPNPTHTIFNVSNQLSTNSILHNSLNIEIYQDKENINPYQDSDLVPWVNLEKKRDKLKENTTPATPWNGITVKNSNHVGPLQPLNFKIYQDVTPSPNIRNNTEIADISKPTKRKYPKLSDFVHEEEDLTINTLEAMKDLSGMFTSRNPAGNKKTRLNDDE